jgi:hypothetical protein
MCSFGGVQRIAWTEVLMEIIFHFKKKKQPGQHTAVGTSRQNKTLQ